MSPINIVDNNFRFNCYSLTERKTKSFCYYLNSHLVDSVCTAVRLFTNKILFKKHKKFCHSFKREKNYFFENLMLLDGGNNYNQLVEHNFILLLQSVCMYTDCNILKVNITQSDGKF